MEFNKYLRSDKRIYISNNRMMYVTTVHSVVDDKIYIVAPMNNGSVVHFNPELNVEVGFWEPNGIFSFYALLDATVFHGQKGLYHVTPTSPLNRIQRRNSYRIYVRCKAVIEVINDKTKEIINKIETRSLNISIGGMCIRHNLKVNENVNVICRVDLEEFGEYISKGITIFCNEMNSVQKSYAVGVQFMECSSIDQRKLSRFIRSREIMIRRK